MTFDIMKQNAYRGGKLLLHAVPVFCVSLTSSESCFLVQNLTLLPLQSCLYLAHASLGKALYSTAGRPLELHVSVKKKKKSERGISLPLDSALWLEQREGSPSVKPREGSFCYANAATQQGTPLLRQRMESLPLC